LKAKSVGLSVFTILGLAIGSCTSPTSTEVNVCYSGLSGNHVTAWYAFEKGLFDRHGLDVNLSHISGGSQAATAIIAGEMDFCQVSGSAVVNAVVAGEDLVMIGGFFNTFTYSLMVAPDVETADDLRGRAVAIASKRGGSSDSAARAALNHLGLEPDKDVALLTVGGQPARLAAMETGEAAGAIVSVPQTAEAREMGFAELVDLSALNIPYQQQGIATTRSYVEANRDVVVRLMQVLVEAIALMKEDKEGAMAAMAKYLLLDVEADERSLSEAYDVLVLGCLPQAPYPTLEGIEVLLAAVQEENPNATTYAPEDAADLSIVQELEASGFIADLYD
jgi:NitT/TauT family transport system substrate-binding protein